MTGVFVALREELAPILARARNVRPIGRGVRAASLGGQEICVAVTGDGAARAEREAGGLLRRFRFSALVGAGIAGALSTDLVEGDVLLGREVRGADGTALRPDPGLAERGARVADRSGILVSAPGIVWTAREKAGLLAASGTGESVAVDVESAPWARAAAGAGVPFLALRVVLDPANEDLPAALRPAFRNGSLDRFAVAAHALRHPSAVGELLRLRQRTRSAMTKLAECLERFFTLSAESR